MSGIGGGIVKDAYERRALLLHLGDVLQAVNRLMNCSSGEQTVDEALAATDSLKGLPLLTQVSSSMTTRDFVRHAVAAFRSWPKELLELELDREQLAREVQRALFVGNAPGWHAYVATLREEVVWFGTGLEAVEQSKADLAAASEDALAPNPLTGETAGARADSSDIESDDHAHARKSRESVESVESVESDPRFYPSWPWKSEV